MRERDWISRLCSKLQKCLSSREDGGARDKIAGGYKKQVRFFSEQKPGDLGGENVGVPLLQAGKLRRGWI